MGCAGRSWSPAEVGICSQNPAMPGLFFPSMWLSQEAGRPRRTWESWARFIGMDQWHFHNSVLKKSLLMILEFCQKEKLEFLLTCVQKYFGTPGVFMKNAKYPRNWIPTPETLLRWLVSSLSWTLTPCHPLLLLLRGVNGSATAHQHWWEDSRTHLPWVLSPAFSPRGRHYDFTHMCTQTLACQVLFFKIIVECQWLGLKTDLNSTLISSRRWAQVTNSLSPRFAHLINVWIRAKFQKLSCTDESPGNFVQMQPLVQ